MKFISNVLVLVQIAFVVLKVIAFSVFASLSWMQVFIPLFIYLGLCVIVLAIGVPLGIWATKQLQKQEKVMPEFKVSTTRKSNFQLRLEEAQRQEKAEKDRAEAAIDSKFIKW
jgi:ABC-type proline/glycine betaine transport system permease subunit